MNGNFGESAAVKAGGRAVWRPPPLFFYCTGDGACLPTPPAREPWPRRAARGRRGVLLVFNFLVLPAVTGLLLGAGMASVFTWSAGAGVLAAAVGFALSVPFDLPTGPATIAVSGAMVFLAWLIGILRPARG